jgi:hypothetical protein
MHGTAFSDEIYTMASSTLWKHISNSPQDLLSVARMLVQARKRNTAPLPISDYLRNLVGCPGVPWGLALLKNVPHGPDPRRSLLLLTETLGTVVRYQNEGDYIIEIKQDRTITGSERPGFNNCKEFFPHTDLSYVDEPPTFLCLHSIQNHVNLGGVSQFVDIADITPHLSAVALSELQREVFLFPPPRHYIDGRSSPRSILKREKWGSGYSIRFRRDDLRSITRPGIDAVIDLCHTIQERMIEIFLEPNTLAIINNRRALHGRTAFTGDHPMMSRQINRLYFEPNEALMK